FIADSESLYARESPTHTTDYRRRAGGVHSVRNRARDGGDGGGHWPRLAGDRRHPEGVPAQAGGTTRTGQAGLGPTACRRNGTRVSILLRAGGTEIHHPAA